VRIGFRKVVIVLAILTVAMTVATVYTHAARAHTLLEPKSGLAIQASEVDQVPLYGVVITDPHPYLIEAIKNQGHQIYVGTRPPEEVEAVYEQVLHRSTYVEYEGKYYRFLKLWVTLGLKPPNILRWEVLGFLGLGACWVTVAYTHFRKNKKRSAREVEDKFEYG
jgi:hypothetical protein